MAIHEVLRVNQEIRDAISNGMKKDELRKLVYAKTETLLQDGLEKALNGDTTIEEILKLIELDVDDVQEEGELNLKDSMEEINIARESNETNELNEMKEQIIHDNVEKKKEKSIPIQEREIESLF